MMVLLFLLFIVVILLAWFHQRRWAIYLFIVGMVISVGVFVYHIDTHLNISL